MAYDLFFIPGMSSKCEQVFSQAKKLITDERNRLRPATTEADEYLKNWITTKLVEVSLPRDGYNEDNTGRGDSNGGFDGQERAYNSCIYEN